jgi:hypothetical protein
MTRDTEPVPTLADLIREHQDKTGDSYGDIARHTGLSKAKIGQLARPENTYLVRQETLTKLARGLSLPLATVQRASLGTAGFVNKEVQRTDSVRAIVERLEEMSPRNLALIADLVEAVATHNATSRRG